MGQVHKLRFVEPSQVDFSVVDALQQSVGPFRYQQIAEDVVLTLNGKISKLSGYARARDYPLAEKQAAVVARIAAQIGLRGVAQSARDATQCAARGDSTALAAQIARMTRLADSSLVSVVEFGIQAP